MNKAYVAILILVLTACSRGHPDRPPEKELSIHSEASAYSMHGKYGAAINILTPLIGNESIDPIWMTDLAMWHFDAVRSEPNEEKRVWHYREALRAAKYGYELMQEKFPDSPYVPQQALWYGATLAANDRFGEAVGYLQEAEYLGAQGNPATREFTRALQLFANAKVRNWKEVERLHVIGREENFSTGLWESSLLYVKAIQEPDRVFNGLRTGNEEDSRWQQTRRKLFCEAVAEEVIEKYAETCADWFPDKQDASRLMLSGGVELVD